MVIPQLIPGGSSRGIHPFMGSAPIPQRIPGRSAAESRDPPASQPAIGIEREPRIPSRPPREWVPDRRRSRALSGNAPRDGGWMDGALRFGGSGGIPNHSDLIPIFQRQGG
jgi:hypothetical protein